MPNRERQGEQEPSGQFLGYGARGADTLAGHHFPGLWDASTAEAG